MPATAQEVIPLSVPEIRGNEWNYVKECLDTNWVSYVGPFVERFERELAVKVGARHAVATSSGTAALHVALLLAGVGWDDEVVMPGLTFVAPANAVRYCGAWPCFTDIRSDDWQWDISQVADFLERGCAVRAGRLVNRQTGRRIAALLPVHLLGGMCDVDALAELASRFGLPVVEDAAECVGALYKGRGIGAAAPAYTGPLRIVITSFNGNKIITTGGGGAIFLEDEALARRARHLTTTAKADRVEFLHDEVGYNYRLTNVAAALGVAQLENLDAFVECKRRIAATYAAALGAHASLRVHPEPDHCVSIFWMYSIVLSRPARPVVDVLNAAGIMSRPMWLPLHRLPAFREHSYALSQSVCEEVYQHALSLPCSVGLAPAAQQRVVDALGAQLAIL